MADRSPRVRSVGVGDQGVPMAVANAQAGLMLDAWARLTQSSDAIVRTQLHAQLSKPW